jgi:hypothetical protein
MTILEDGVYCPDHLYLSLILALLRLSHPGSSPVDIGDYPEKGRAFLREVSESGVRLATCATAFHDL